MLSFILKILISSFLISFASWLSFKKPNLAGFIISLPLVSIIALAFSYTEFRDLEKTVTFAKSIFIGIPVSLLFFIPFFFSKSLGLNFLTTYISGIALLVIGFFVHKHITSVI